MPKFSGHAPVRVPASGPIRVTDEQAPTYEGGDGRLRDARSELFLLAATNMVGEDTFYESAPDRDKRYRDLIAAVTADDPTWIAGGTAEHPVGFVGFLRDTMQMRSASTVMAAEYVKAGGPNGRAVVSRALQRADEPAEILGYWHATHGRRLPAALKRGIADACQRLYTERAALKYDGQDKAYRMGDVIDLVHPTPKAPWQSDLFCYLLDKRHKRDDLRIGETLAMIRADLALMTLPEDKRRAAIRHPSTLADAGWSWERLAGWLPGGMDAEAWSAVIPEMGYMACLRNLRNFEQKGIPEDVKDRIIARLSDPAEVAKSRQFPYRFWSAYKANAGNLTWGRALERALDHSCANIPAFDGGTLVLVDLSGSMTAAVSAKSQVARYEIGALFGAALWKRSGADTDVVCFGQSSAQLGIEPGASVLKVAEYITALQRSGQLGHATYVRQAILAHYKGHRRVVVFTDEQGHDTKAGGLEHIPHLHVFNLAGYRVAMAPHGQPGVHSYGGFTDATFRLMPLLEAGYSQTWAF